MELLVVMALAAIIVGIGLPAFISISKGASAKEADNLVHSMLRQAQQHALVSRQRVVFGIVTDVVDVNNPWVGENLEKRGMFLYAAQSPDVARDEGFVTTVQALPAPMRFDFSAGISTTNIPERTMRDPSGNILFYYRGFRFAPNGGVYWPDAELASNRVYHVVITEGLRGAGNVITAKTNGPVIKYTNAVNVFTGKVFKP
jgi:type II secretory pathway pseudopilin PulG